MNIPAKNLVAVILWALSTVCLAQDTGNSPADVAKAFVQALWDGNKESATSFVTKESTVDPFPAKGKAGSADPKVVSAEVLADKATVVVDFAPGKPQTLKLAKENGDWKVDVKATTGVDRAVVKQVRSEADISNLETQVLMYEALTGMYPSTEQGVRALVERPETAPAPRKWRQVMAKLPVDYWGTPYGYKYPAVRSKKAFDVYSLGPDRKDATADDIGNWSTGANIEAANEVRSKVDVMDLAAGLEAYEHLNGTYPSIEQGIRALVDKPATEPSPKKWSRLLEKVPVDPWGTPYTYKRPAVRSKRPFDLYSLGPDRTDGTADDIGNW